MRMTGIIIWVLIFYLIVASVAVLLHALYYFFSLKFDIKIENNKQSWLKKIERMKQAENYHLSAYWLLKLSREKGFRAFLEAIEESSDEKIISANQKELLKRALQIKSEMGRAFAGYMVYHTDIISENTFTGIDEVMFKYLKESNSVFTLTNSILALSKLADEEAMIKGIMILNQRDIEISEKILIDQLKPFSKRNSAFEEKLMQQFDQLKPRYQVLVVDYMQIASDNRFNADFRNVYLRETDKLENLDLKCSIVRLLDSDLDYHNTELFLQAVKAHAKDELWSLAAVSATALGKQYRLASEKVGANLIGSVESSDVFWQEVKATLKQALTSKHWYVRLNSARALSEMDIEEKDLLDVLKTGDTYGREILWYSLKQTDLHEEKLADFRTLLTSS